MRNKPGGPDAFVGTTLDPRTVKQRIFEQTDPSLAVDVEVIEFRRNHSQTRAARSAQHAF